MRTLSRDQVRHSRQRFPGALLAAVLLLVALPACGPVEEEPPPSQREGDTRPLTAFNGLSLNGLSLNGLSLNGLSLNGLSLHGLSSSDFARWFSRDPDLGDEVMTYVVRCALPSGQSLRYTDARTGRTYTWTGTLGLTPDWASGKPVSRLEQQLLSACLAAHVNKYDRSVSISVLGKDAKGRLLFTESELTQYAQHEACFFGNLFEDEGVYAGNDRDSLTSRESTPRGCGLVSSSLRSAEGCPPIIRTASCQTFCRLDSTGTYYTSCTYNGLKYVPLTTRLRREDIYRCGDGTCQFTESCGTGGTSDSCEADCGRCP